MKTCHSLETKIRTYWNSQPCNINHSSQAMGSKEYFEEVRNKKYRIEPHIMPFANFDMWKGRRVLEIGCGIGTDAIEFARAGADYTGIDISDASLTIAEKRFEVYQLNGKLLNLDATSDSFTQLGSFDLIYSFGVLHHYPNVHKVIDSVSTMLTANGKFKFMVYAQHSWKYAMIKHDLAQFEAQANCPYAEVYTKEKIHQLLDKKFTIDSITQDHCFMYQVDAYKQGQYKLEPWFEQMPLSVRHAVEKELGWHLLVTASLKND
jgi:2-polyprenyl-3-methyl-5-hydroxy-6-metoxy-1,4-benzoquinol methylase